MVSQVLYWEECFDSFLLEDLYGFVGSDVVLQLAVLDGGLGMVLAYSFFV